MKKMSFFFVDGVIYDHSRSMFPYFSGVVHNNYKFQCDMSLLRSIVCQQTLVWQVFSKGMGIKGRKKNPGGNFIAFLHREPVCDGLTTTPVDFCTDNGL